MAQNNRQKGKMGEDIAADFLEKNGYNIIIRNYAHRFGEIDIIAEKDGFIVFIEVKYRKSLKNGSPREAVGFRKQQKIRQTALAYISENNITDRAMRFDVIEVTEEKTEQLENAF